MDTDMLIMQNIDHIFDSIKPNVDMGSTPVGGNICKGRKQSMNIGVWAIRPSKALFKYAVNNDMCTEDSYPYLGVETIPCFWQGTSCTTAIKKEQITGYKDVAVDSYEDLMSAVAQQPVAVVVGGSGHWGTYTGGVFTDCDVGVGYAVTLVGYGTDPTGGDYWKLKNSWGSSFGIDGGYILIGRNRGVKEGECGIAQHASYPVVAADTVSV